MYKNTGSYLKNKALIRSALCVLISGCSVINLGCMSSINRTLSHIEAEESYYKGDFTRTFRLTEAMAYQGDKKSEYTLGYMYYYGIGAPQNKPLGIAWMAEAAKKHYPPAIVALNVIHGKPIVIEEYAHPVGPFSKKESKPEQLTKNETIVPSIMDRHTPKIMAEHSPVYSEAISYVVPISFGTAHTTVKHSVLPSIADEIATISQPARENVALNKNWTIQLGTFSVQENAQKLVNKLIAAEYPAFYESRTRHNKTFYLVFVGPYTEKEEATHLVASLKLQYGMPGIVKAKAMNSIVYAKKLSNELTRGSS